MEQLKIIGLYPLIKGKRAWEQMKVAVRYWPMTPFLWDDLRLALCYLGKNPYRICRRFLEKQGANNVHTYGETPLTTLEKIAKWAGITAQDVVYDLGCGPGRTSLWLYHFVGCSVVGVEQIPEFVRRTRCIANHRLSFLEANMLTLDYGEASVVYLYGTTMGEGEIRELVTKLHKLPKGAKVITVSYPLTDYDPESFQLVKTLEVPYTWGRAEVFLQLRRTHSPV